MSAANAILGAEPQSSGQMTPKQEEALLERVSRLEARTPSPQVSVVIAAYNVGPYLMRAVESVLNQTLRNLEVLIVDDHSTDQTLRLAVELAEKDNRVRILRTKKNSGGPGEPRNIGIEESRSKYFTFLDGDDVLELHACKTMLEYAESSDADLVVGRTERYHVKTGRTTAWYSQLFVELREAIDAEQMPELLSDSIAAGKLYKRAFTVANDNWLLNGVHFEDLIFTARAYAEADKITIVPSTTYYWYVYPEDERISITAQNDTLKNVIDRRSALQMVDSALQASGKQSLIERSKYKFLWHDAKLYLNLANDSTDEWLYGLCDILIPKLETFERADWGLIDVFARWIYGSVLNRDLEGIRQAILFSRDRGMLSGRQVEVEGRTYWQPGGTNRVTIIPGTLGANLLDITDHPVLEMPRSTVRPRTVVTQIAKSDGETLLLKGHTDDLLGCLTGARAILRGKLKDGHETFETPIYDYEESPDGGVDWSAKIVVPDYVTKSRPQRWIFSIHFIFEETEIRSPLRLSKSLAKYKFNIWQHGKVPNALRRKYRTYVTENKHLGIRLLKAVGRRGKLDGIVAKSSSRAMQFKEGMQKRNDRYSLEYAYSVMRHLPIDNDAVLCESMSGRSAWDSPRYVAEELMKRSSKYTVYWVYSGQTAPDLPHGFVGVRRWSPEYLRRAATAKIIIDNQTLANFFRKRAGQVYLQTWHGTPLKKMGLDSPEFQFASRPMRESLVERGAEWDALICPSDYFRETFVKGYSYHGDLVSNGSPRNDILIQDGNSRGKYKDKLGLPRDRKVVLYAPTFRQSFGGGAMERPRDVFRLKDWADRLGTDTYLVVHPHYLDRFPIPKALAPFVMAAPRNVNVNDLYLASDLLITDYSSVMFDYALLKRPMIFFAYDYDSYVSVERGTYFSLKDEAPGPVVKSFDSLLESVEESLAGGMEVGEAYERFVSRYCGNDDGLASRRAVDYLLAKVGE
ncbi:bifunctional glycosyltransferase family 2 protein/CDP-glycerol:glycerophosphate glycerophosphotransferase [Brevibacterium sp. 91QC2O2]|uniref:bifunctional glycosyltransferase/CDP-glycerol:glycerophosphate glycerophosphotransferase n=1 Tax=Brevibacterium sp. 91QC2O2 TaxID=2968458 RepID=UPI00211C15CB|nr:bifunctional glycosyltransferase family 2 protein/CDP-glycerol:glycerophosphate glycerophosphotransferase [Brevibacterium sp. 91QC2O2]MCQ9367488.1 bifunctional glycosyltransferase family 2 protein/CDP-glycerol:glycerophosphate glycerophosphotransferase [Brevibacterium sp. 91QC2O2]